MQNYNHSPVDINEILIHEIAKRPQIYDSSLCTKNKTQIRRDLWGEIYEALNHLIAYDKLPKIWKNIRDRYQKIKKDMEKDGRNIKPRYRYYDMLRFLDDVDCNNPNLEEKINVPIESFVSNFIFLNENEHHEDTDINHLDPVTIQEFHTVKEEIFSNETKSKKLKLDIEEINSINHHLHQPQDALASPNNLHPQQTTEPMRLDNNESIAVTTSSSISPAPQPQPPPLPSAVPIATDSSTSVTWSASVSQLNTPTKAKQTEEFVIFGSYVAEVMKNMDKQKARLLQMKVMQLITEYDDTN